MADVILSHVKKVYDKTVPAVQDFHMHIRDKEFVVLVGPSGCGKSTTLRMIAGLEEITEGTISIDGKIVNRVPPKDRNISMVFQDYALYPHMTVFDNIAYGLKLRKYPKRIIQEKVMEAAQILDIVPLLKRKPKALSGGQRQRVAIGRAIVREPSVFLMDEPLSNLDAKLRNQMRAELIQLRKRIQTTFVYVTHDQTEAMTLGDRIVIMKDGYIQQIGTPREVFHNPANLFVAGFIGTPQMNFFQARLNDANGYSVTMAGKTMLLPEEKQERLRARQIPAQDIILGIRPEHILLEQDGYEGIVEVTELMGSNIHLHIRAGNEKAVIVVPEEDGDLEVGQSVRFVLQSERLHLFSKDNEENLEFDPKVSEDAQCNPTNAL